jgi:hypothetical protein
MKPLCDLNQTARSHLRTLGRADAVGNEGSARKRALASGSVSPQIKADFWAAISHRLGGTLQLGRVRAAGAAFRRPEAASVPFPEVFGTFAPVIPFWFRTIEFCTCFCSNVVHGHPEMVFLSTYFIYRRFLILHSHIEW